MNNGWRFCAYEPCAKISFKRGDDSFSEADTMLRCSNCEKVHYCSRDCQRNDWTNHGRECQLLVDAFAQDDSVIALNMVVDSMRAETNVVNVDQDGESCSDGPWHTRGIPCEDLRNLCVVYRFDTPDHAMEFVETGCNDALLYQREIYHVDPADVKALEIPGVMQLAIKMVHHTFVRMHKYKYTEAHRMLGVIVVLICVNKPGGLQVFGKVNMCVSLPEPDVQNLIPTHSFVRTRQTGKVALVPNTHLDVYLKHEARSATRKARKKELKAAAIAAAKTDKKNKGKCNMIK